MSKDLMEKKKMMKEMSGARNEWELDLLGGGISSQSGVSSARSGSSGRPLMSRRSSSHRHRYPESPRPLPIRRFSRPGMGVVRTRSFIETAPDDEAPPRAPTPPPGPKMDWSVPDTNHVQNMSVLEIRALAASLGSATARGLLSGVPESDRATAGGFQRGGGTPGTKTTTTSGGRTTHAGAASASKKPATSTTTGPGLDEPGGVSTRMRRVEHVDSAKDSLGKAVVLPEISKHLLNGKWSASDMETGSEIGSSWFDILRATTMNANGEVETRTRAGSQKKTGKKKGKKFMTKVEKKLALMDKRQAKRERDNAQSMYMEDPLARVGLLGEDFASRAREELSESGVLHLVTVDPGPPPPPPNPQKKKKKKKKRKVRKLSKDAIARREQLVQERLWRIRFVLTSMTAPPADDLAIGSPY